MMLCSATLEGEAAAGAVKTQEGCRGTEEGDFSWGTPSCPPSRTAACLLSCTVPL